MDNEVIENNTQDNKFVYGVYDLVSVILSAVVAIMLIFTFVFRFVGVVGSSMEPNLSENDWLLVSAISNRAKYGDVVIVTQPNDFNEPIVKRVIATENQEVDINFETGDVFVDGKKLDEPYIQGSTTDKFEVDFPVTVPEGHVFVMGDNRNHSSDSRSSKIGFIDENYILGKVKLRVFPFGKFAVK